MTTHIKFCGFTHTDDLRDALSLAAVNYFGFVFVPSSQRYLTHEATTALHRVFIRHRQPHQKTIALFANHTIETILEVINIFQPDLIQFHGNESAIFCRQFELPYLKAVPMLHPDTNWHDYETQFHDAFALLADSHGQEKSGGSGTTFDWSRVPHQRKQSLFLAGGLNPDNVRMAIHHVKPNVVDVSSGIEVSPGRKSALRMRKFIEQVNQSNVQ